MTTGVIARLLHKLTGNGSPTITGADHETAVWLVGELEQLGKRMNELVEELYGAARQKFRNCS